MGARVSESRRTLPRRFERTRLRAMRRTLIGLVWTLSFVGGLVSACALHRHTPPLALPPPLALARVTVLTGTLAWVDDTVPVLQFKPPPIYGMWRLDVERCSSLTRAGWPKFYIAPIPLHYDDILIAAFYVAPTQNIVFSLGAETQRGVVAHELLHWLLELTLPPAPDDASTDARITRQHPPEYFERRCGALFHRDP